MLGFVFMIEIQMILIYDFCWVMCLILIGNHVRNVLCVIILLPVLVSVLLVYTVLAERFRFR